jgi:ethanolaminephosphotransferase
MHCSPNMIPKQIEMDGIVQRIYQAMVTQPHLSSTLFVLCGDHGMNEGGNHGGSAIGETSPALVFISPKFKRISTGQECPTAPRDEYSYYDIVEQSDVAPTIAALLGVPIPLNNLGVFIKDFLPLWPKRRIIFPSAKRTMLIHDPQPASSYNFVLEMLFRCSISLRRLFHLETLTI